MVSALAPEGHARRLRRLPLEAMPTIALARGLLPARDAQAGHRPFELLDGELD